MKESTSTALTVTREPALEADWRTFRALDTEAKIFGVKAGAALILSGVELERLHAKYAVHAGGDHFRKRADLLWPEMLARYGGLSEDTAARRRKLALAAAECLPILREVLEGEADPSLLPVNKKLLLEKCLRVLAAGKSQGQLFWEFGLAPKPKPAGGFRPNAQMLQAWLARHHQELKGAAYDDLPAETRQAFKKQYRAPGFTPEQESEMTRDWWRTNALGLAEQLHKKTYNDLDARDRQWIALAYYDGWKALSAVDRPATSTAAPGQALLPEEAGKL